MKTTNAKPAKVPAASEECGVWLDTAELREKKQHVSLYLIYFVCQADLEACWPKASECMHAALRSAS